MSCNRTSADQELNSILSMFQSNNRNEILYGKNYDNGSGSGNGNENGNGSGNGSGIECGMWECFVDTFSLINIFSYLFLMLIAYVCLTYIPLHDIQMMNKVYTSLFIMVGYMICKMVSLCNIFGVTTC